MEESCSSSPRYGLAPLRVKIKSLAAEALIIRAEERRVAFPMSKTNLANPRRVEVGGEARSAILAYRCIRGKSYSSTEAPWSSEPDWKRIKTLARKYGARFDLSDLTRHELEDKIREDDLRIEIWIDEAMYYRSQFRTGTSSAEGPDSKPVNDGFDSHSVR